MEQRTFHAFIVYRVRMLWSQVAFMNTNGFAFIESFPDRESAEKWIVEKGKRNVNYTVLEVFRKKKVSS